MKTVSKNRLASIGIIALVIIIGAVLIYQQQHTTSTSWPLLSAKQNAEYKDCIQSWNNQQQGDVRLAEFYGTSECMARLAIENNDVTMCNLISESNELGMTRFFCIDTYAQAKDDLKVCSDHLTDPTELATCITKIALKRNDVSLCASQKTYFTHSDQSQFNDTCYDEFAEQQNNSSLCEKIINRASSNIGGLCHTGNY